MNECSSQPLCPEVLTVAPPARSVAPGSAKSGRLCLHSGDRLRNEDANSLEAQSTAERFIAKEESQEKRGGGSSEGQSSIPRVYTTGEEQEGDGRGGSAPLQGHLRQKAKSLG